MVTDFWARRAEAPKKTRRKSNFLNITLMDLALSSNKKYYFVKEILINSYQLTNGIGVILHCK